MESIEPWITLGEIVGITVFLRTLQRDIAGLRERMARLEGLVDVLANFLIDRECTQTRPIPTRAAVPRLEIP